MADVRKFTDRGGVRWSVSEVPPPPGAPPPRERRRFPRSDTRPPTVARYPHLPTRALFLSWLRFESHSDCRSFEPAPQEWRTLSDEDLEALLERSTRISAR